MLKLRYQIGVITSFWLIIAQIGASKYLDTSRMLVARQKRTLIWEEGINWVQMVAGIGLPIELKDQSITMGAVVKSYYLLPNNSTYYTHPTITLARKKRDVSSSRWRIYEAIVNFFTRFGYNDSKACLLRAICEVASQPFDDKSGLFSEILQILLKPSSTKETIQSHGDVEYKAAEKLGEEFDKCHLIFPECKSSILSKFTKFLL